MSEAPSVPARRSKRRLGGLVGVLAVAALFAGACSSSSSSSSSSSGSSSGSGGKAIASPAAWCGGKSESASSGSDSGSTSSGASIPTPSKDATLAAKVPSKVASTGKLVIATDASYAPNEFFDTNNKTVIGMDADLGSAIASVLGLKADVQNAGFDTIIPALGTRYDIGMSSFTDNKKRQAQVNFVDYFTAGTSCYAAAGSTLDLNQHESLCGLSVGVEKGTTQLDDATAQSKLCTAAGRKAVDVQAFPDQNGANQALASGRVQVVMADSPVAAYAVKQSDGKFQLVGVGYGQAPYGIAIPKTSEYAGLEQAIQGALQKLESDGTYMKILEKWGVQDGAVKSFTINGGTD